MLILMCLISCLFGFANVHPYDHMQKQVDNVQYVEEKTKDNYVRTASGYYQYATSDLFSYDFLVGLVSYYVNDLNQLSLSYGNNTPVSNYVIQTNGVYTCYGYAATSYHKLYDVSNIVIDKYVYDAPSNNPVLRYTFTFSNSSPYDKQIMIKWLAQRTIDNALTIWGVELTSSGVLTSVDNISFSNSELYTLFMLSELIDGYNSFIGNVFQSLHTDLYNDGYTQGYNDAYGIGYAGGYNVGHNEGYYDGEVYGYQQGYTNGVNDTQVIGEGTQASIIFGGILDVAFIPVNVFLLMFQYEVFGINIAGLVSGLISIALIIILIRVITGKKLW